MISVIMPVYNEEAYITTAIRSILNQSYSNFELIIFNDGSTDRSLELIKTFKDPRIRVFTYNNNQGYVVHLNRGILESKGKYIARMDADDISVRDRFEQQVSFLETHPEISILGGWYKNFGGSLVQKYPLDHDSIKTTMLTSCPMVHPTIMMRKACILKHRLFYHPDYLYSEDFELWSRAVLKVQFANLPKVLLERRIHGRNVSIIYSSRQRLQSAAVRKHWIQSLINKDVSLQASAFLEGALTLQVLGSPEIKALVQAIIKANEKQKIFQPGLLKAQLDYIYLLNGIKNIGRLKEGFDGHLLKVIIGFKWSFLKKKFTRISFKMKIKRMLCRFFTGEKSISQYSATHTFEPVSMASEFDVGVQIKKAII